MGDWENAMGIEVVYIDRDTRIHYFKKGFNVVRNLFLDKML